MKNGQFLMLLAFACVLLALFAPVVHDVKIVLGGASVFLGVTGLGNLRADE